MINQRKGSMKTPHKHAEVIKAYADGAEIEFFSPANGKWETTSKFPPFYDDFEYRVKPEPKADFVAILSVSKRFIGFNEMFGRDKHKIQFTFCGETGELKSAELL